MIEPAVIAIDVGGTSFKGALVDEAGRIRRDDVLRLDGASGPVAFAAFRAFAGRLRQAAAARGLEVVGAGVVAPGMDEASGRVLFSSNLGWRDLPVRDPLSNELGVPVAVGHDVRGAGLAESLLGAGRGAPDFVFVVIGTGIAAAVMANGAIVSGAGRMGGEFGHIPIYPGGERCACGQSGCLEAYASASAIARRHQALGGSALTAAEIGRSAEPLARRVWDEAIEALSLGLATLTMVLDPQRFILGGGLAEAGARLLDPLGAALDRRLAWRRAPPLCRSPLGAAAGLLGAALLGWQAAGRPDIGERWPTGADPALSSKPPPTQAERRDDPEPKNKAHRTAPDAGSAPPTL